jgi:hypothetical protein
MAKKLIFLDFDGVLHPYPRSMSPTGKSAVCGIPHWEAKYNKKWQEFMCMTYFAMILRRHDNWEIVLSTAWREPTIEYDPQTKITEEIFYLTMDDLRGFFPKDIAAKIIGSTPVHKNNMREEGRYHEIVDWLTQNDRLDNEWVALDDIKMLFPEDCENLLHCDDQIGFAPGTPAALKLQEFLADK